MRRLILAAVILAAVLGATFWNTQRLNGLTGQMLSLIDQAGGQAQEGAWDQAGGTLEKARALWDERSAYLHMTLRHADIDAVTLSLTQLEQYTRAKDAGQWALCAASLSVQLNLLSEMEALTLKNVL